MNQFRRRGLIRRFTGRLSFCSILPLLFLVACSRPGGLGTDDAPVQTDQHPAPFQEAEGKSSETLGASTPDNGPKSETGLPFRDSQSLPVGTLLTVRLKDHISADNPGPGGTFEALVDEPVTIDGNTLVPRGSNVAGRVESARASQMKRNHGYVRLALDSIDIAGRDLRVQTSSLFARGTATDSAGNNKAGGSPVVISLEKGRRLTIRLTEPVYVASQQSLSSH